MEQPGVDLGLGRSGEEKCVQSLEAGGHVFDRPRPLSWLGEPEPSNLAIRIKVRRQYRLFAKHDSSHPEYLLLSAIDWSYPTGPEHLPCPPRPALRVDP